MNRLALVLMAGLVSLGIAAILLVWRVQIPGQGRTKGEKVSVREDHPRGVEGQGRAESAEITALWREAVSLRLEIEALKTEVSRLAQASAAGPSEEGPARSELRENDNEEDVTSKHVSMVAKVADDFLREVRDPSRAAARESRIRELTEKSGPLRHAIQSVDCRSATCRVEMVDDAAANLGETMSLFISDLTGSLPLLTTDWVKAPDGTGRYILYMGGS